MLDRQIEKKSDQLTGKRIAFGVCSGIGSVEVVRIVRELRRHGADVTLFITEETERFVGKVSLEWASHRPVVAELTAQVDGLEEFDLVVIAPLTLNTLIKLSLGLCDNPVTMVAASHLGRGGGMLLFPTMHGSLANHPAFGKAVATLQEWGAKTVLGSPEEGRLKMPSPEVLTAAVVEFFQ